MSGNILIPIIALAVIVLIIIIVRLINRKKEMNYDERQLLARNAAYKSSFFFLIIYCSACGLLHIFEVRWADTAIQMFLGVIISFLLFIALCIMKDAYFSNSTKRNVYSVVFFFWFGILYFINLMMNLSEGEVLWENGELTYNIIFLVSSICFLILGILSIIKIILEKRGAEKL